MYALQQGLALSSSDERNQWLEDAQKACDKVLGAISSWHRLKLLTATLSPIVVGLLIARLGAEDIYDAAVKVVSSQAFKRGSAGLFRGIGVAYFVIAVTYLLLPVAGSFSYKRGLFYPAGRVQEQPKWRQRRLERQRIKRGLPPFEQGTNIYPLENALFDMLEVRKQPEARLDLMVTMCSLILVIVAYFLAMIDRAREDFGRLVNGTTFVLLVACLLGIVRSIQMARRRKWR
jgi:hypothetical protein